MAKNKKLVLTQEEYTYIVSTVWHEIHDLRYLKIDKTALAHDYFVARFKMLTNFAKKFEVKDEKPKTKN